MSDTTLSEVLLQPALEAAPLLLGAVFRSRDVAVRLTEVEAYLGEGQDQGSHAHRGRTTRNGSMWREGGTLYVYLSYGIHRCVNIVCGPAGEASAVLLRAGEIVGGVETARARRGTSRSDVDLARGPGRLGSALGIVLSDDGAMVGDPPFDIELAPAAAAAAAQAPTILTGPRVGVSGTAGTDRFAWRFWLAGEGTVSAYRPAVSRRR